MASTAKYLVVTPSTDNLGVLDFGPNYNRVKIILAHSSNHAAVFDARYTSMANSAIFDGPSAYHQRTRSSVVTLSATKVRVLVMEALISLIAVCATWAVNRKPEIQKRVQNIGNAGSLCLIQDKVNKCEPATQNKFSGTCFAYAWRHIHLSMRMV
jgi:hypothetical protein